MTLRRSLPFATFAVLVLFASPASANGAVGVAAIAQVWALLLGALALVLAAVLGVLSWVTVLRPPKSVGWVFGRGFLAVSAIVAFAIGGVCITLGLGSTSDSTSSWFGLLVVVATMAFFAIEFVIAGTLYRRSNAHRPSNAAQGLSIASYVLAGLSAVSTVLVLILGVFVQIIPTGRDHSKSSTLTSEARNYQKGCDAGDSSDCNMLGLRHQNGASGLPPNPSKAMAAFKRSCDLGAAIGCRNLAGQYRSGELGEKNPTLAETYERRYAELAGQGSK